MHEKVYFTRQEIDNAGESHACVASEEKSVSLDFVNTYIFVLGDLSR